MIHRGLARPSFVLPAAALLAMLPGRATAHTGGAVAPDGVWRAWTLEPGVLLAIGLSAWLYARGTRRLWSRAGVGRGLPRWRFRCFAAGLVALGAALVSPLDALGGALFSGHMVQHEVLILVSAPLLVLGAPLVPLVWALPMPWRRRVGRWAAVGPVRGLWRGVSHPASAWTLHALALWVWHAPRLYQATLRSEPVHLLQHVSFLGSALLFWWALLHPGRHARLGYGAAVLYVFTTAAHGGALGAILTFAGEPWYPAYGPSAAAWGLTALEDQQLGGLIMWIPFGLLFTVAGLALFAAWLRSIERRVGPALGAASPLAGRR